LYPSLSESYLCQRYAKLLQQHELASFEALWQYQGDWFESPNHERGGWSGVNFIELTDENGDVHGFYLKRQDGHLRKTWRHPIAGEPTFVREFKILQFIRSHNVKHPEKLVITPELVFFARKNHQSILVTKSLDGFVAADVWLKNNALAPVKQQRALMQALAKGIQHLHAARVQHRSLYLKHLFVRAIDTGFEVALIDFEKSRVTSFIGFFKWMDLIKLHQRASSVNSKNQFYFFTKYINHNLLHCIKSMVWKIFFSNKA
jgi:serine/threonine protein kinase